MFWENFTQDDIPHSLLVNFFNQDKDILKKGITKFSSAEMHFCL